MDTSQVNDGVGVAVKIRLAERQRVIPAVASSRALLELQFVDTWTTPTDSATPQRRRSDIEQAAARQGKDLHKLANDFRDRLALVRDAGLTTGDTLAFSRAVRTYLDRFLAEDGITLTPAEKSALADIILRAAVGYGPLDPLLHDRSVSEIMVNGPDQVFIERRGVLAKAEVRFDDENQLLETIRRMVATTGRHIAGLNPMVADRILVGEVRGAEALDMLQAMNTGHDGSMSTIHSNSARDALSRLETMVMMASIDIPFEAVRAQIASAVNLIVHQARMPDGRRKVAQIAEVVGYDSNGPILRDIFLLGMGPDLRLEYNATGAPAPPYPYPEQTPPPPVYAQPPPGYNPLQDVHAHQALEAATAMARATTALGQLAAASSGFSGMLPTVHATEGAPGPAGASRRIQAVIESIITRRGLSLRLAPGLTETFEGAELKASDYAKENKISRDSAGRELRLAAEAGLLQIVRYPQGEAGFRASQGMLREIAEGLGQPINTAAPLTAETIIGSLAVGQTEGTVTIMFTDVEESTRLLSTRGFTASHEIMKSYETIIDEKVSLHAGRRIKGLGDGFMISFGSARHGVECALDIQQAITEYSKQNPERKLRIRIGLNTGEVVEEGGDIFGAAVNVAARVAGKAKGGEILVSEIVRQLVGPIAELTFDFRGRYKLKGFPDRWRLHEVTPGEVKEAPRVPTSADGFVDREQERLDIRMVLDRAATGSGSLVFLTGAPGVGASRLATEVAGEAAAKGWLVLSGRCLENDGGPYGSFRDILTAAVAATPAKALLEAAGDHGPLLATLAPSLRQKARGIAAAHEVHADKVREQLVKAVHQLLRGIQGRE